MLILKQPTNTSENTKKNRTKKYSPIHRQSVLRVVEYGKSKSFVLIKHNKIKKGFGTINRPIN